MIHETDRSASNAVAALALAFAGLAGPVNGDEVANGGFENTSGSAPWAGFSRYEDSIPRIEVEGAPQCSYARMAVDGEPACDYSGITQDELEFCSDNGYATVQFDVRSSGADVYRSVMLSAGGTSETFLIPPTGGAWVTCRFISVELEESDDDASILFRINNRLVSDCGDRGSGELHIDNVQCFVTVDDMTNIPIGFPCDVPCFDAFDEFHGSGAGCELPAPCYVEECAGDVDHNGSVDFEDVLHVLSAWGRCPAEACCIADVDGNGMVEFADLLIILSNWGTCP